MHASKNNCGKRERKIKIKNFDDAKILLFYVFGCGIFIRVKAVEISIYLCSRCL